MRRFAAALAAVSRHSWVDLIVLSVLSLIAIVGFEPAFGPYNYLIAGLGGLVLGTLVALGCAVFRLNLVSTSAIALLGYLLFGSPLTMPEQALLGVLPSGQSLGGLFTGAIFGWADIVTLQAPVQAPPYIAVVPYAATWIVAMVFVSLTVRWLPRKPRTAPRAGVLLIGPTALFLAGILLGTSEPYYAGIRGVAFAGIALVWLGWRRRNEAAVAITVEGAVRRRKLIGVAVVVLGAVVVGSLGGVLLAPAQASRFVLRQEVTPPFDPLQFASPLAGYRSYTKKLEKTELFSVTGLADGQKIRMAALDSYNGQVWRAGSPAIEPGGSGGFELLGRDIPRPAPFTAGSRSDLSFSIEGYDSVWLPGAAYASTLDFQDFNGTDPAGTVRINTESGTAAVTSGVRDGLTYRMSVTAQAVPKDKALTSVPPARIPMPPVENIPDVVLAKAEEYAGSAKSAIQKLRNIERSLKTIGYLSHGLASDPVPSRAGHGADRMAELFSKEPMVGDEEQYASAFALMASHLGYPVRVVMGFAPKVPEGATTVQVTGHDVTAWDEVAFEGVGWIPFFPTPTKTDAPKDQTTKPKLEPQPQVRQPPRSNQKQEEVLTPVKISDKNPEDKKAAFELPVWAYWVGGALGIPLLAYFVPLLIIAALKRRRRHTRRGAGSADARAAGSWDELADGYAELGLDLPPKFTRLQAARALEHQCRDQSLDLPDGGLTPLAARADAAVFSAVDIAEDAVQRAWDEADAAAAASAQSAGWLRRQLAALRYHRRRQAARAGTRKPAL